MVSSFDLFPIGVDGVTSKLNKLPYSDVYGSWIASSSQLTKRYWFHDGLDVSRETQGGVVKLLVMVFENSFSCRC